MREKSTHREALKQRLEGRKLEVLLTPADQLLA
jgi:hypothetical protein